MKKLLLSILTVMYMTVSSGIAMEIHYCMGEKAGVDFYKDSDDKCGRCGMKEQNKKGCCSDDHKFFKLDDSHQKAVNDYTLNPVGEQVILNYLTYAPGLPLAGSGHSIHNNSPPVYLRKAGAYSAWRFQVMIFLNLCDIVAVVTGVSCFVHAILFKEQS